MCYIPLMTALLVSFAAGFLFAYVLFRPKPKPLPNPRKEAREVDLDEILKLTE